MGGFGQAEADVDDAGVVAFALAVGGAFAEGAIEFRDDEVDGFVGVVGGGLGDEIGTADFDAALGDELGIRAASLIEFEIEPDAHDARFVAEELTGFFVRERLERGGEVEVDAADDEFIGGERGRRGMGHTPGCDPAGWIL